MDKQVLVICTGGFDPLHSGHIGYFAFAKRLYPKAKLIVGINNDAWLRKKKGYVLQGEFARKHIVESLRSVDGAMVFAADALGGASNLINELAATYPDHHLVFANGGDRNSTNIPEANQNLYTPEVWNRLQFAFSVGGDQKVDASSKIAENAAMHITWMKEQEKTKRPWGYYQVLYPGIQHPSTDLASRRDIAVKVKKLVIHPGASISLQKHKHREEYWKILSGVGMVALSDPQQDDPREMSSTLLEPGDSVLVGLEQWHCLSNLSPTEDLVVLELQHGSLCSETDIDRYVRQPDDSNQCRYPCEDAGGSTPDCRV